MNILTFRILSHEKSDFIREIDIPDEKNFYDLHRGIQAACNYDNSQMTSFFMSNENWEKLQEISMLPMEENEEKKPLIMKDTLLKNNFSKKGERLLYLFDFFSVRMMFIELVKIRKMTAEEAKLNYPRIIKSEGKPPQQMQIDDFDNDSDILEPPEDETDLF